MKKISWSKILNISIIIASILVLGFIFSLGFTTYSPKKSVEAEDLVEGVPFRIGTMERQSSNLVGNNFTYLNENVYKGELNTIYSGDYVMLYNYKIENDYKENGPNTRYIDNIYMSFGDETEALYLTYLSVYVRVNGVEIIVNNVSENSNNTNLPTNITKSYYWYDYFDGKSLTAKDGSTIATGEGLYEFQFDYGYVDANNKVQSGKTYKYSFYLLDQGQYDEYPQVLDATKGKLDSTSIIQYYYNYEHLTLPKFTFDASRFNVTYTREKNKDSETITTSFESDKESGVGTLYIYKNDELYLTETIEKVENSYPYTFTYDDLGTYKFDLRYLVRVNNDDDDSKYSYLVVNNILPYDIASSDAESYENGDIQKGQYKLHLFGVKAYFSKPDNLTELKQYEDGVMLSQADQTYKLYELNNDYSNSKFSHGYMSAESFTTSGTNTVSNPLYNFNNYPKTNLPPILFDYYSSFKYDGLQPLSTYRIYSDPGFTKLKSGNNSGYITKDTSLDQNGYYEVIVRYTFDFYSKEGSSQDGTSYEFVQIFTFQIQNTTPEVTLYKYNEANPSDQSATIDNNTFINQNISATWVEPSFYEAEIEATYTKYNFDDMPVEIDKNIVKNEIIGDGSNGKYEIKLHLKKKNNNSSIYTGYSFVIDKTPIQGISIKPIFARKNAATNQTIGYSITNDINEVNFENKNIINQPFTLIYDEKASGASIKTTYYKIPFIANSSVGRKIDSNGQMLIETNYLIDASRSIDEAQYNLNYAEIKSGIVSDNNAFHETISYIYIFEMRDDAGNYATKYLIYDLTKPYVIVDADATTPEIDKIGNIYGIVNKEASLTWGTHKAIKINADITDGVIVNEKLKNLVEAENKINSNTFQLINDSYYLCIPIKKVTFTQGSEDPEEVSNLTGVTIYPKKQQDNPFFSGDDRLYSYQISDESNIQSLTNMKYSSITKGFIRMFLDNAQGIMYGNFSSTFNSSSFNGYEDLVPGTTSANQLRFTYIKGTEGSEYYVKEVSYTYYDYAETEYKSIDTIIDATDNTSYIDYYNTTTTNDYTGAPCPTYPFSKTPSISNRVLSSSSLSGVPEGRTVTEIINPTSGLNGAQVTKPGMYVIKREYQQVESGNYENDSIVRYYVYYVDRSSIIDIDTNAEDVNIYNPNLNQPDMLYETGSGIILTFANPIAGVYNTYYTALQIQQYLSFSGGGLNIVDSNKLPINFDIPVDKYNTNFVLAKSDDIYSSTLDYINDTTRENGTSFGLRYKIYANNDTNSTLIFDNTEGNIIYNTSYIGQGNGITLSNNVRYLKLIKEGTYVIQLYDTSDNRTSQYTDSALSIERQYNNTYSFSFTITHESPVGQYFSKYNDSDRSDMYLDAENVDKTGEINNQNFVSINKDALKFKFSKSNDQYKAEIDPSNIVVTKKVGNTTTTYNSTQINALNALETPSDDETSGDYILTIFDEYEYNNLGRSYLGGTGNNRDYLLAKSNNIEYTVTLQYVGNESDYTVEYTNYKKNFFKSTFKIVVDRQKPQYNYQQLITLDSQKFDAVNTINSLDRLEQYFYTVDNSFVFMQNSKFGGKLDSAQIYIRKLSEEDGYPTYYKTYTPDDDNFYSTDNPNHIRFSESDPTFRSESYGVMSGYSDKVITAEDLFIERGYYEVVEKDEAGNYSVYGIYYNPNADSNTINYKYKPAVQSNASDDDYILGEITTKDTNTEILGKELIIDSIYATDYYYKCIITYDDTIVTLYNDPNDHNNNYTDWSRFIDDINKALEFTKTASVDGHSVTITFINRLNENYVIEYKVPGERLEPIFVDINQTEFNITIPNDNDSTKIIEFHVWKFTNGSWVEQSQDSTGRTIIKSYSNNVSLQGKTYRFGLGEYKFQLIDNFGRGSNLDTDPPYYKGVGVNDVRDINYGTNIIYNGIINTANNVTLSYQTNLYRLIVKIKDDSDTTSERDEDNYITISEEDFEKYSIVQQSISDGVRKLLFQNTAKDTIKYIKVTLIVDKTNTPYTYEFAINKTLTNLQLKNLSGGSIVSSSDKNDPSIHTENFYITWDSEYPFGLVVNLTRTYLDNNNKQQTENISNIPNGYEVNIIGTYTATVSNLLGYSDSNYNIYFKLTNGEIVVYDVLTVSNGLETIVRPSPKTTTYTDPNTGTISIMYNYYVMSTYNNPVGSTNYVEVRPNKNKGISFELMESTLEEDQPLKRVVYKIFGASNYAYNRYIQIIFVDPITEADGLAFSEVSVQSQDDESGTMTSLPISSEITSQSTQLNVKFKAYYTGKNNDPLLRGNLIYADYYFNDKFVRTIYSQTDEYNQIVLTNAGVHRLMFYDLAGNVQSFGTTNMLTINLVNNVLFTINGSDPINSQIFNDAVTLEIINRSLYYSEPTITVTKNSVAYTPNRVGSGYYEYLFTEQGYYEVEMYAKVTQNESVTTKYVFTIINKNIALACFSLPQNAQFTIVELLKDDIEITYDLESLNELWISPSSLGVGVYTVTLSKYNTTTLKDDQFTFVVWVNNEKPYIESSIDFGTSTTKEITIKYNPKYIYDQIGESYISITGKSPIPITASDVNEQVSQSLTDFTEYWIKIYSADDKLVASYKVTRKEPLNSVAIIIIVVVSVVVVGLVVVFIVIRRKLKFR